MGLVGGAITMTAMDRKRMGSNYNGSGQGRAWPLLSGARALRRVGGWERVQTPDYGD